MDDFFGRAVFDSLTPVALIEHIDFFAGSGTSGHAILNLTQAEGGRRPFPRIINVIRLESYEDTLSNLELRRTMDQYALLDLEKAQGADKLKESPNPSLVPRWWLRTATGTTPDGRKTLVVWPKRPGGEPPEGIEQDNLVLDERSTQRGCSSKGNEFDLIYVNGDNDRESLKAPDDNWKVRLIEEELFQLMFHRQGV